MREPDNEERRRHWSRLRVEDGSLPAALAARCLMRVVSARPWGAAGALGLLLALAWAVSYLPGGAGVAVPHGYYVPVLLAAVRFGRGGALLTALLAGIIAGPLTYQDVATATGQAPSEWITRTAFFVLVGQLAAWLLAHALTSVQADARLARDDRELRRAIERGEISVRYQPVVRLEDDHLVAVEALVRWDHPDGERGPGSFLPTAFSSGCIHEIGHLVLRTACQQAARWQADARQRGVRGLVVSVNLSAQELAADGLVSRVRGVLDETGLDPRLLCLEVTEGALAVDIDGSAARLAELRHLGVRIAIDDFGTGYSSLSYVHRFPMDLLKIDRSFVEEMEASERARTMIRGIVLLCRQLGVRPVVEGIETEAQLRLATDLRCGFAQGFHLGRPERAEVITERHRAASTVADPRTDVAPRPDVAPTTPARFIT